MDLDSLTLEEKVGQLFVVGFNDTEITGDLVHLLTHYKVGGLFFREENVRSIKQLHKLSTNVQYYAKTGLPLFLAIEQAGGKNNTVKEGLTMSPSQATIGRANNRLYTTQMAEVVAKELRGVGINMNLAPVLNGINGDERHFGDDIDSIAKHGVSAVQGYEKGQVAAVVKSLPETPTFNLEAVSFNRKKSALYPFFRAIKHGVAGIYVSNSMIQPSPNLEYTHKLLKDIFRERTQYDGLFMSELAVDEPSVIESAMLAIEADIDVMVIPSHYKIQIEVISAVVEAVKAGIISEERINQSVKRIIATKEKLNMDDMPPFDRDLFRRKRSLDLVEKLTERATVSNK